MAVHENARIVETQGTETNKTTPTFQDGGTMNGIKARLTRAVGAAGIVLAGFTGTVAMEKTAAAEDAVQVLVGDQACARPSVGNISRENLRGVYPRAQLDSYEVQEGKPVFFVFHRPIGKAEGIASVGKKVSPVGPVEKEVVSVDDPRKPGHEIAVIQDVVEYMGSSAKKANSPDNKDTFVFSEPGCPDIPVNVKIIERDVHMGDLRPVQKTQERHGEQIKTLQEDSTEHGKDISALKSVRGRVNASFKTGLLVRPGYSPAPVFGGNLNVALGNVEEVHGELGVTADVTVGARAPVENYTGFYTNGTAYQTIISGGPRLSAVLPANENLWFILGGEVRGQGLIVNDHDIGNSLTQRNPTISQTDGTVVPAAYFGLRAHLGKGFPVTSLEVGTSLGVQVPSVRERVGGDDPQRANAAQQPLKVNQVQVLPAINIGATWH